MQKLIFIAFGGAIGTLLRYFVSGFDYRFSNGIFPSGTLLVNLTGSLIIGFLWGIFERFTFSPTLRMFIFVGLLGGFTTFSTFNLENFALIRSGELKIALANILISNIVGIILVFAGFMTVKILMNSLKGGI